MAVDMAIKDSVDSLPPSRSQHDVSVDLLLGSTFKYSSIARFDS